MRRAVLALALAVPALADDRAPAAPPPPPGERPVKEAPAPKHTNLLAKESSPYLLQHAHNPVDWHPWGDAAFEKARREGKPVFLSIGYSTCHWCHVMERESFEDGEIAKFLNEHFVSVKVDREERPDVDAVYMAAVVATTGQGGWPMTVFLNHDRKPFFCGTYFPPEDRHGRPGFPTLLRRIHEVWTARRGDVDASADEIARSLRETAASGRDAEGEISAAPLARAVEQFRASYDERHGGYGPSPKFPRAFALSFLLERTVADPPGAAGVREQVEATLDAMRRGGIHDHVGGGFHRYSTDREWLVPHFEKMLYDQATLVHAYVDAWLVSRNPDWERTARGAVEYVLRDLRDPAGGFRSAEDADSEGHEGKFYVWTEAELAAVLGDEDAAFARRVFSTHPEGNFRDEASGVPTGANILHLRAPAEHHAKTLGVEVAEVGRRAESVRARLFAARAKRVRPHLDDKVLADWNGLMIGAAARAGAAFGDPRYVAEAARAADFVLREMRTADGVLLHRWRKGAAGIPGFLEDHAFLALGLLDLWEATFDPRWLREARDLCRTIVRDFRDADGTIAHSSRRGETLLADPRDLHDGAVPSGNSAAALALLRAGATTGDADLAEAGRRCLATWMPTISRYPAGYPFALRALARAALPAREVVIAGDPGDPATQALLAEVRRRFLPDTVVLLRRPGDGGKAVADLAPFTGPQDVVGGKPAAYVCRDRTCAAPVTTPAALAALLDAR